MPVSVEGVGLHLAVQVVVPMGWESLLERRRLKKLRLIRIHQSASDVVVYDNRIAGWLSVRRECHKNELPLACNSG
jgi:hypothetical protein